MTKAAAADERERLRYHVIISHAPSVTLKLKTPCGHYAVQL
jgi:hypothetical protein